MGAGTDAGRPHRDRHSDAEGAPAEALGDRADIAMPDPFPLPAEGIPRREAAAVCGGGDIGLMAATPAPARAFACVRSSWKAPGKSWQKRM